MATRAMDRLRGDACDVDSAGEVDDAEVGHVYGGETDGAGRWLLRGRARAALLGLPALCAAGALALVAARRTGPVAVQAPLVPADVRKESRKFTTHSFATEDAMFQQQANAKCGKYKFWTDGLFKDKEKKVVAQYPGKCHGGIGDTFAGFISAAFYALLTDRALRFDIPDDFKAAFSPARGYEWENISMVAPASGPQISCCNVVDCEIDLNQHAYENVVTVGTSRSWLCQWWSRGRDFVHHANFANHLIAQDLLTDDINLWELGGCLLRAAIVPSPAVWSRVAPLMHSRPLVCAQYRTGCSDNKLNCNGKSDASYPSDTPQQMAQCMVKTLEKITGNVESPATAVVTSDSPVAKEIISNQLGSHWTKAPTAKVLCHTDGERSNECTIETVVDFMSLALCDAVVTQTRYDTGGYSFPPSGFSRYAGIYGLHGVNSTLLAANQEHAVPANMPNVYWKNFPALPPCSPMPDPGRVDQGNWRCSLLNFGGSAPANLR